VLSTYVGAGVSISVGNGVGRRTPGVGARVLLVPALVEERMLDATMIRKMEDFMLEFKG
jgi:hypothetical protein